MLAQRRHSLLLQLLRKALAGCCQLASCSAGRRQATGRHNYRKAHPLHRRKSMAHTGLGLPAAAAAAAAVIVVVGSRPTCCRLHHHHHHPFRGHPFRGHRDLLHYSAEWLSTTEAAFAKELLMSSHLSV